MEWREKGVFRTSASIIVGRKSWVTAGTHVSRCVVIISGQTRNPGTRIPPSQVLALQPRTPPVLLPTLIPPHATESGDSTQCAPLSAV
jgi:hypothetical protein